MTKTLSTAKTAKQVPSTPTANINISLTVTSLGAKPTTKSRVSSVSRNHPKIYAPPSKKVV